MERAKLCNTTVFGGAIGGKPRKFPWTRTRVNRSRYIGSASGKQATDEETKIVVWRQPNSNLLKKRVRAEASAVPTPDDTHMLRHSTTQGELQRLTPKLLALMR